MITEHRPESRARTVALVGLCFQVLLTAFLLILSGWGGGASVRCLTLLSGVGTLIWLFLVLIYQQKVLVRDEAFETEQLRKEREAGLTGGALFDVDDESLLLAKRRLRWMFRWLLPAFTVLVIAALVGAATISWPWAFGEPLDSNKWPPVKNTGMMIWFLGGAAFLSFLFSRYAAGMGRLPESRMLRAGSSWMMGVTLAIVAVAATLTAMHFGDSPVPERVVAKVLRVLLLVLAAEVTLNFVLDFYRPRAAEEEPRPAFESRLLGLFSEPGGIARSIADALNYQFGFEVSSTWFYKLLQRSMVPLLGFAVLALLAASSLVFVGVNEQAVLERFGRRMEGVLEPGLHVKYPWPIDRAYKVKTAQIHEIKIGIEPPPDQSQKRDELILWTNKHEQEPHLEVLVATPDLATFITQVSATRPSSETATQPAAAGAPARPGDTPWRPSEAVAVSLMRVAVTVQYSIRDAYAWLTTYHQPEEMLKAIANREINRYCASVEVKGLIGGKRAEIEAALWQAVQKRADEYNLAVDIVFLGLQGVHPPESTAQDFQDVVGAEQKAAATIRSAQVEYNKKLSEVAGDVRRAEALAAAIRRVNELSRGRNGQADSPELEAARAELNALFLGDPDRGILPVGGKAAEIREKARAERWRVENEMRSRAERFELEMAAYEIAPQFYRDRRLLSALVAAGESLRKYIVASNGLLQLNLQDPMSANIQTAIEQQAQ